jgi:hypothetical protein
MWCAFEPVFAALSITQIYLLRAHEVANVSWLVLTYCIFPAGGHGAPVHKREGLWATCLCGAHPRHAHAPAPSRYQGRGHRTQVWLQRRGQRLPELQPRPRAPGQHAHALCQGTCLNVLHGSAADAPMSGACVASSMLPAQGGRAEWRHGMQVTAEGEYIPPPPSNQKASYATMVYVRATIVEGAGWALARSVTIAVSMPCPTHAAPPQHMLSFT